MVGKNPFWWRALAGQRDFCFNFPHSSTQPSTNSPPLIDNEQYLSKDTSNSLIKTKEADVQYQFYL